nr:hypothetical protein [Acidianus brierleyi]
MKILCKKSPISLPITMIFPSSVSFIVTSAGSSLIFSLNLNAI